MVLDVEMPMEDSLTEVSVLSWSSVSFVRIGFSDYSHALDVIIPGTHRSNKKL